MKEGWTYKRLGDICEILNGFAFKSSEYVPSGIRVIRITNVQKGIIVDNAPKFYPEKYANILSNFILREGDLLMSLTGNVGRVGILPKEMLPAALNQRVACLRLKDRTVSKEFLYFLLNSNNFEELCIKNSTGAAQLNMSTVWLANVQIPIPPLAEQEKIVSFLDAQFAKIDALKANIEQQLQAAKDLFQSALKQMLTAKEGWEKKTLGDIAKSTADGPFGSNLKAEHYTSERQVRIIQLSNIGDFCWRDENVKYTTFEHLKTIARSEVKPNEVVIAKMMPAGRAILCPNIETKYVLSSDAVRVELKEGYDPNFIQYYINSNHFNTQVIENVTGSGRVRTSLTKLRSYYLYIPNYIEQKQLAKDLDIIYAKIIALQANYDQTINLCNDLKQSLLKSIFE